MSTHPLMYASSQTTPAKRKAGRPKETVNGACAAAYIRNTHGMRCSSEVRAWAMAQRSCCPSQGSRMCQVLDRAATEARRDGRKTVTVKDLERALSFETYGMSPSSSTTSVQPTSTIYRPVMAYGSSTQPQQYAYYPSSVPYQSQ